MSKFTYKEIKEIINNTPDSLKGVQISNLPTDIRVKVGGYVQTDANWGYIVHSLFYEEKVINVVTVFGLIC